MITKLKAKVLYWRAHRFSARVFDAGSDAKKAVAAFLYKQRWPPFLAAELFLPRLKVLVVNHEEALGEVWIEVEASRVPEDVIDGSPPERRWRAIARHIDKRPWKRGENRTYRLKTRSDSFAGEGSYSLRIKVIEIGPVTEKMESRGIRIEQHATMTVNSTTLLHEFKVHPPVAAIAFLGLVVAAVGTIGSLLASLIRG